jgi:hypothetical protein
MSISYQMDKLIFKDTDCRTPVSRAHNFPNCWKIEITFKIIDRGMDIYIYIYIYPNFSVWCISYINRCQLICCTTRAANKGLFRIMCLLKQSREPNMAYL